MFQIKRIGERFLNNSFEPKFSNNPNRKYLERK
jgi:hypothetical protein